MEINEFSKLEEALDAIEKLGDQIIRIEEKLNKLQKEAQVLWKTLTLFQNEVEQDKKYEKYIESINRKYE